MLKSLKNFFHQNDQVNDTSISDLHLLIGLMIETAYVDGKIDQKEINKISKSLIEIFDEDPTSVEDELNNHLKKLNENKSLHFFTSRINKSFTHEKKLKLIEILWEIILEDEKIHDFETNLIRRLAGLLYISDVECGKARKKITENNKKKI